jgi:hypothetical protein
MQRADGFGERECQIENGRHAEPFALQDRRQRHTAPVFERERMGACGRRAQLRDAG